LRKNSIQRLTVTIRVQEIKEENSVIVEITAIIIQYYMKIVEKEKIVITMNIYP